jgi:hypothetical protein
MTIDFEIIEKENIGTLKFPHSEVLEEQLKKEKRIRTSTCLREFRTFKIQIYFEDDRSKKMVETTVWALTDLSRLKKGVGIPINRILMIA